MKFLRIALCAAALGFASAEQQLTLRVPRATVDVLAEAHAAAHGVELEQFRNVRNSDFEQVVISRTSPGLSEVCYDALLDQNNDPTNGEQLDFILGRVAAECTRLVTREAITANEGALITTIACPINAELAELTERCSALGAIGPDNIGGGTVADYTITQDITRSDRPDFFVRLSVDYYQCVPFNTQGCSASDVEAVGVALAAGLANVFFVENQEFVGDVDNNPDGLAGVVDVRYSVTGLVFNDELVPQGIFGGAPATLTSTTIEGSTNALETTPLALFVLSDDLGFPDVTVLSTVTNPSAPETCKNMAASLNTNGPFRSTRCVADCQERMLPAAQLNIWCPTGLTPGAILIREGNPNLPSTQAAVPITNFDAISTGFDFSGSGSTGVQIPPVRTNAPAQNQQPAELPNGNLILTPGAGLPITVLPDSDGSSSLAPTVVTTAVCLVFAVVARRFC